MKFRCIIVDDEYLSLNVLETYIQKIPHLELAGRFSDPMAALSAISQQPADILFCDVNMPQLSGIDLVKSLPTKPMVIFTTAFKEHALDGFELNAVDFLVKPIRFERFVRSVNKATNLARLQNPALAPPEPAETSPQKDYRMVKSHHKTIKLRHDDILYIQGLREYVTYHTATEKLVALESLKKLESALPDDFMRIHKSYIVAMSKVDSILGNMLEINGTQLPIGGSYKEQVLHRL